MTTEDASNDTKDTKTEQNDQETGFRVYIGNISFKTKPEELKEYFADCGQVDHAKVATHRSGRRLGFGFVTFETEEGVNKAIQKSGEELDGRVIKVEVATGIRQKPRVQRPKAAPKEKIETPERTKRIRVPRVPPSEREVSDNIVYVAGLKDDTTEEEVTTLLADYNVQSVSLRRAYRGRDQPRALFAFVYVDGGENQQKVVDEFEGKEYHGETLIVKKAFKQPPKAPRAARSTEQSDASTPKKASNRTRKPATSSSPNADAPKEGQTSARRRNYRRSRKAPKDANETAGTPEPASA